MVKAERGSLAGVLQRLRGKSLVVTMQEAEERKHTRGSQRKTITLLSKEVHSLSASTASSLLMGEAKENEHII